MVASNWRRLGPVTREISMSHARSDTLRGELIRGLDLLLLLALLATSGCGAAGTKQAASAGKAADVGGQEVLASDWPNDDGQSGGFGKDAPAAAAGAARPQDKSR